MADIVALVLPFFGLILIGFLVAKVKHHPAEALGWLNVFIIYVALPALFFKLVAQTPIEDLAQVDFIAADLFGTYLVFALVFIIGRYLRRNAFDESVIQAFGGSYGNIGYMGPGLGLLAFGEQAAVPVALVVCFENALHFMVAPAMMAMAGDEKRPPHQVAWEVVRKVSTHPFIVATALGFLVAALQVQPPVALQRLIDYLAQAAAPCALFAMGVTLALRPLKRIPVEIGYIVPVKLVVHPLLMWVVLSLAGNFDPVWIQASMLLAALPAATNVFVLAQQYGVWQERASATILITTALSVVTVSLFLYAMKSGLFPADLFP
ncbi:AEC family transporter [Rhizobium halophytocola]|uniref:Permease n=1 Tax=Rhizobium halophytocola TaxID=735519 RepID=A0ABS4DWJ4_9HYPH|nr:AEC family transporter [Rhizobium halophytocola]MBP1850065.1 putative permease [Rhizobium halophytocola]